MTCNYCGEILSYDNSSPFHVFTVLVRYIDTPHTKTLIVIAKDASQAEYLAHNQIVESNASPSVHIEAVYSYPVPQTGIIVG